MRILILFLASVYYVTAQDSLFVKEDKFYREDQFYASITYNTISNTSSSVIQDDFSTGFHIGFIRDMPINQRRNWALGLGLGLSSNSYNQNIIISETAEGFSFETENLSFGNVSKNKFTRYFVDVPLEIRWRTSTTKTYKFWRIYAGLKFSYLLYNSTNFQSDATDIRLSNISAFNSFQYGLTLSAGYGTWNFYTYYGLSSIFENNTLLNNGDALDINALKFGIMFYIL